MRRILLLIVATLLFGGCNWFGNDQASPPNRKQIRVNESTQQARGLESHAPTADRLERLAESVPQVQNATCVVFGNTAVVGINVEESLDRARVGTIKYTVAEALKKDPSGANALVTADIDLNRRLAELRAEINRGRPVAGFAQEMADIIGRIMPQLPRDVTPRQSPPAKINDRENLKNRSL